MVEAFCKSSGLWLFSSLSSLGYSSKNLTRRLVMDKPISIVSVFAPLLTEACSQKKSTTTFSMPGIASGILVVREFGFQLKGLLDGLSLLDVERDGQWAAFMVFL